LNSLVFLVICSLILLAGYKIYGGIFERFLGIEPSRTTPAYKKYDGVDYVPAKHWFVLFGHHFSSIAGAGPVIGPVLAVGLWGWAPATLFVILGTIFIGGVHDMGSILMSVRHDGKSVADISEEMISRRARLIFSWFVLLALVVVISVFIYFCSQTFMVEPKIVLPSFGLIPVAILVGIMIYRLKVKLYLATIVGLSLLVGLIVLGQYFPIMMPKGQGMFIWTLLLLVYCFVASTLPVNVLLQPRDYLASYMLLFGIVAGFLGIITARPDLTIPAFVPGEADGGPIWPMLFVTVACGAISGFHSLVAAGTTSKQIANERDAKVLGFGAMVIEAVVAVIAIIAVAGYFKNFGEFNSLLSKNGPVSVFGLGFGHLTRYILGGFGTLIALILLNSFILTTLDTATRIARYILQELFGTLDRYLATTLIILAGGWMAMTGEWKKIWPVFGAANQLIAALTLVVLSSWLLSRKKHTRFTLLPAVFMLVATIAALGRMLGKFVADKDYFLVAVDVGLMILAGAMVVEVCEWIFKRIRNRSR